jgi:hypothetical protein
MSLVPPGRAGRREPASSVAPISHSIWALPASLARTPHRTPATKHIMLEPLTGPQLPETAVERYRVELTARVFPE